MQDNIKPKDKIVTFYMLPDMQKTLTKLAKTSGLSRSKYVRKIIENHLIKSS